MLSWVHFDLKGKSKEAIFKEQEERKEKKTCVGLCYLTKVSHIHMYIDKSLAMKTFEKRRKFRRKRSGRCSITPF